MALGRYLIRMFTKKGDTVLDNAFGSGSFLVAAALEERRYIGIEKNEEVHLFKKEPVDYINVAKLRLKEVEEKLNHGLDIPPLFSFLQPNSKNGQQKKKGMVNIDEILKVES